MINIKIAGQSYGLPSLREITLSRFVEFLTFLDLEQPAFMRNQELKHNAGSEMLFFAKELRFWTGCNLKILRRCAGSELYSIWAMQQEQLRQTEDKSYNCFSINSQLYFLPKRLMQLSTIEDYAEANEYEKQFSELKDGVYSSLPFIAAVLCRKENEGFDDYDVEERAAIFAEELTAYDLFQVGFFLLRQSEKLAKDLQIYTTSMTIAQLRQVFES